MGLKYYSVFRLLNVVVLFSATLPAPWATLAYADSRVESPAITLSVTKQEYQAAEQKFLQSIQSQEIRDQTFSTNNSGSEPPDNPDHLSDTQLKAIYAYTFADYVQINRALRAPDPTEALSKDPSLEAEVLVIRTALQKIKDIQGTVYRGVKLPADQLSQHQVGKTITYAGFSSASKDRTVAEGFALEELLILHIKHGKSISAYSQQPREHEILLDHGTHFKVTGRKTIQHEVEVGDDPETAKTVKKPIEVITLVEVEN